MSAVSSPSFWLDALEAELAALAEGTLGLSGFERAARGEAPVRGMEGAYLGLFSPQGAWQVGLAAFPDGCQALARGLLAVEPGSAPLPEADVADALCEIVNILAGGVKRRAREQGAPQLTLGLPTFFHGAVQPTERLASAVSEVRVAAWPAALVVLHPRLRPAEEA